MYFQISMQDKQGQLDVPSSAVQFVTVAGWLMSVIPLQRLFDADDNMVDDEDDEADSMPATSQQYSGMHAAIFICLSICLFVGKHSLMSVNVLEAIYKR